jgi:hypothetical protein
MTAILLHIFFCALFALFCADREDEARLMRIHEGNRAEADHFSLTWLRVLIMGGAAAAITLFAPLSLGEGWYCQFTALLLIAYGTFTPIHRILLNGMGDQKWYYIDDLDTKGNFYDEFWWIIAYVCLPVKRITMPNVARMAYAFEITVLCTTLFILLRS